MKVKYNSFLYVWLHTALEAENARKNPYRNLKSVAVETKSALDKLYANYKSEVCDHERSHDFIHVIRRRNQRKRRKQLTEMQWVA